MRIEAGCSRSKAGLYKKRLGQVVVEMLLILPIFLTIIFSIMEMGHLAFWVIVVNHATYESARIGAMRATPQSGGDPRNVNGLMQKVFSRIIKSDSARINSYIEETIYDRQANIMNHDLVVTGSHDVKLVFPISNILLANPRGSARRHISTTVRMPIERPLQS